jgi:hypothetical protein
LGNFSAYFYWPPGEKIKYIFQVVTIGVRATGTRIKRFG